MGKFLLAIKILLLLALVASGSRGAYAEGFTGQDHLSLPAITQFAVPASTTSSDQDDQAATGHTNVRVYLPETALATQGLDAVVPRVAYLPHARAPPASLPITTA